MSQLKRLICCFLILTAPLAVAHPLWVVTEVTPPLQSIEGEQVTGETTTTVRNILQQLQLQADFYAYPWARSYKLALERPNTLIYPLARTPEREGDFIWLQKILSLELQFVALKHQGLTLNKLAEAKAYVTGVSRGDLTHQTLLIPSFILRHRRIQSGVIFGLFSKSRQALTELCALLATQIFVEQGVYLWHQL